MCPFTKVSTGGISSEGSMLPSELFLHLEVVHYTKHQHCVVADVSPIDPGLLFRFLSINYYSGFSLSIFMGHTCKVCAYNWS